MFILSAPNSKKVEDTITTAIATYNGPRSKFEFLIDKICEETGEVLLAYTHETSERPGEVADIILLVSQLARVFGSKWETLDQRIASYKKKPDTAINHVVFLSVASAELMEYKIIATGLSRKTVRGKYGISDKELIVDRCSRLLYHLNCLYEPIVGVNWDQELGEAMDYKYDRFLSSIHK